MHSIICLYIAMCAYAFALEVNIKVHMLYAAVYMISYMAGSQSASLLNRCVAFPSLVN